MRAGLIDDLAYEDEIDDKVELSRAAPASSSSTNRNVASTRPG